MAGPDSDSPSELLEPFLRSLPVTGAAITVITPSGTWLTLGSTDAVASRLDELQFELGEGPQWDAARSGRLTAVVDVARTLHERWPVLGSAITEPSVGSLFCVPINMGAVTLGVVSLYTDRAIDLTDDQRVTALAIASAVAVAVAREAMASAASDTGAESEVSPALRREVHQATGMVLAQLDTTATDAYSRLQAYAFAHGRTVQSVARDVVNGLLIFEDTAP